MNTRRTLRGGMRLRSPPRLCEVAEQAPQVVLDEPGERVRRSDGDHRALAVCDEEQGCPLYRRDNRLDFSPPIVTGLDGVPRAFQGETRFSPTVGAGLKFYLPSHKYGLNLGVRWTPTFITSDAEGFWCDPYWGCFTADNTQFAHQVEFAAGVQFRF